MKHTQLTELLQNIKATFVSFFSIVMFVALGVGIFTGISWTAPALENSVDELYQTNNLHNVQIQYPYGVTDEDIKKISAVEGVTKVEPGWFSYQTYHSSSGDQTVKVQTLPGTINELIVVDGELPAKVGEIAMKSSSAKDMELSIGDTIRFANDGSNDSEMKYLEESSFTITALVESPEYAARSTQTFGMSTAPNSAINLIAWVPGDTFKKSAFQDGYPCVNVSCESLKGINTFTDEYAQASAPIVKAISALGDELGPARYDDLHAKVQDKVDEGAKQLEEARQKVSDGQAQIEQGEKTLEEKRAQLESGEQQLAQGLPLLQQKQAEFESGKKQYKSKTAELSEAQSQYDNAMAAIEQAKGSLSTLKGTVSAEEAAQAQAKADYESTKKDLDKQLKAKKITQKEYDKKLAAAAAARDKAVEDSNARIDAACKSTSADYKKATGEDMPIALTHKNVDAAIAAADKALANVDNVKVTFKGKTVKLGDAKNELSKGWSEAEAAKKKLDAAESELSNRWSQYYAGLNAAEAGKAELSEGEKKLEDAKAELEEGKKKVADGEKQLAEGQAQLEEMRKYDWTVLARSQNGGVIEATTFCDVTSSLSFSMAALFIIVGLLVSYSAVSRIVHEQITQIGTKKALGLRGREITTSFLAYSGLAVIVGAIIGGIVGDYVVEGIIGGVLGERFITGKYDPYFGVQLFVVVTALELVLVLGATWLACRSILKEHAVELLKGEKPPASKTRFYEKWGIWEKLPLFTQTIVNNCINDKRRVFSTIVGVAGCTALIITAITLNNDVLKSYDRHYENVFDFNGIVYVKSPVDESIKNVESKLVDEVDSYAKLVRKSMRAELPNGNSAAFAVLVPDDAESFDRIYHVNSIKGEPLDLSTDGVWVTQAYVNHNPANIGDTITVDAGDGSKHQLEIRGVFEYWLTDYEIVMGKDFYQAEFDTKYEPNVIYVNTGERDIADVMWSLKDVDGFYSLEYDKINQAKNFTDFSSVSRTVVLIYLVLAILMAVVVLLNLNVMFIDEKKRELIVLMINGFSVRDAKRYIYNDTIVLTAIGIIIGVVVGCSMGSLTVGSMEPMTATFVKGVDGIAVLAGVLGSAALAFIMCAIALRRISKFNLTDINRF